LDQASSDIFEERKEGVRIYGSIRREAEKYYLFLRGVHHFLELLAFE